MCDVVRGMIHDMRSEERTSDNRADRKDVCIEERWGAPAAHASKLAAATSGHGRIVM